MKSFISGLYAFALSLGGPGLLLIAFLDSSFVSLPQINDLLVVLMVIEHKARMPYYAAMATLGSVAGSYVIYRVAEKGGDAFLRRRLKQGHVDKALSLYRRHGLLALVVPALLPPPSPFKLFVLLAGVAKVRPTQFVIAIGVARGVRYATIGTLAVLYGDAAMDLLRRRGREVAFWMVAAILVTVLGWVMWRRRPRLV